MSHTVKFPMRTGFDPCLQIRRQRAVNDYNAIAAVPSHQATPKQVNQAINIALDAHKHTGFQLGETLRDIEDKHILKGRIMNYLRTVFNF